MSSSGFDGSLQALLGVLRASTREAARRREGAGFAPTTTSEEAGNAGVDAERAELDAGLLELLRAGDVRLLAVYSWGSRVLGTAHEKSDWDFQVVYAMGSRVGSEEGLAFYDAAGEGDSNDDDSGGEDFGRLLLRGAHEGGGQGRPKQVQPFGDRVDPLAPLLGAGNVDDIGKHYFVWEDSSHVVNISFVPLDDWWMLARSHRYFVLDCLWLPERFRLYEVPWLRASVPAARSSSPAENLVGTNSASAMAAVSQRSDLLRTTEGNPALCSVCAALERARLVAYRGHGVDSNADALLRACSSQQSFCRDIVELPRLFSIFEFDVDILRRTVNWESKMRWYSSKAMWEDKAPPQGVKYMFHALRYKINARSLVENNGWIPDATCAAWLWQKMRGAEAECEEWKDLASKFSGEFERVKQDLRDACGSFEVLYGWNETRRRFMSEAMPHLVDSRLSLAANGEPQRCCASIEESTVGSQIVKCLNFGERLPSCVQAFSSSPETWLFMHKVTCNCVRDLQEPRMVASECAGTGVEVVRRPCVCNGPACGRPFFQICSWGLAKMDSWCPSSESCCPASKNYQSGSAFDEMPARVFALPDGVHVTLRWHPLAQSWGVVGLWDPDASSKMCWQVSSHTMQPNPISQADLFWQMLFGPRVSAVGAKELWLDLVNEKERLMSEFPITECSFTFSLSYPRHRFVASPPIPEQRERAVLLAVRHVVSHVELDPVTVAADLGLAGLTDYGPWLWSSFVCQSDRTATAGEGTRFDEYLYRVAQELNPYVCRGFCLIHEFGTGKRRKFENARWRSITDFTDYTSLGSLNFRPDLDPAYIYECARLGRRHSLHTVSAAAPLNGHDRCLFLARPIVELLLEFDSLVADVQRDWDDLKPLLFQGREGVAQFAQRTSPLWSRKILFELKKYPESDVAGYLAMCTKKEFKLLLGLFRKR